MPVRLVNRYRNGGAPAFARRESLLSRYTLGHSIAAGGLRDTAILVIGHLNRDHLGPRFRGFRLGDRGLARRGHLGFFGILCTLFALPFFVSGFLFSFCSRRGIRRGRRSSRS